MSTTDTQLIERICQRNLDRTAATDGGIHPKKRVPCITEAKLAATEQSLGFSLPPLIRSLYLHVGNGGFGPQYGIVGTKGGAKLDGNTLETCYADLLNLANENPTWQWPHQLLPLSNYGCGMWSCVDLTYQRHPMFLWDPNNLQNDLEGHDAQENWSNSFWNQGLSLRKWLLGWLDAVEGPEPKWPSASWTRKRLGFKMTS